MKRDRHRKCSRCRDRAKKQPCPTCGKPMSRGSRTCMKCQPPHLRRPDSPRWQGGRIYRHRGPAGYVRIKAPGHPRGLRNSGLIFEHILVMEQILGRYLLAGETIHHRNGIRDDNRPENLVLWVKPQPAGCRVEDAVAWAREILDRYDHGPPGGGGPCLRWRRGRIERPRAKQVNRRCTTGVFGDLDLALRTPNQQGSFAPAE